MKEGQGKTTQEASAMVKADHAVEKRGKQIHYQCKNKKAH